MAPMMPSLYELVIREFIFLTSLYCLSILLLKNIATAVITGITDRVIRASLTFRVNIVIMHPIMNVRPYSTSTMLQAIISESLLVSLITLAMIYPTDVLS